MISAYAGRTQLKFIPVRGRKLPKIDLASSHKVEIYPREGTETRRPQPLSAQSKVEIYPREGTETFWASSSFCQSSLKFIPVRGRKHGIALPTLIVVER